MKLENLENFHLYSLSKDFVCVVCECVWLSSTFLSIMAVAVECSGICAPWNPKCEGFVYRNVDMEDSLLGLES